MSLVHEFSYETGSITFEQIKEIESYGLEILRIEGSMSGAILINIKGTFDQHQRINGNPVLARLFDLD